MTHQISITVDAKGIIDTYGTNNNDYNSPVGIAHSFVYMVSKADESAHNGTADLVVNVKTGDSIRWRAFSVSMSGADSGETYTAMIYDLKFNPYGRDTDQGQQNKAGVIQLPPTDVRPVLGIPKPVQDIKAHLKNLETQMFYDFFLQTNVVNRGFEAYEVRFALYDSAGAFKGVFWFDPAIRATLG